MEKETAKAREESWVDPAQWEEIRRAVISLRYGSVEITVHDRKVVQIERREKVRFGKGD